MAFLFWWSILTFSLIGIPLQNSVVVSSSTPHNKFDSFANIDPNKELVLTKVEEIKAFFNRVNTVGLGNGKRTKSSEKESRSRGSGRVILPGRSPTRTVDMSSLNPLTGLFGAPNGQTTNIITAAGTLLGAAAAAATQQVAAVQQPGAVVTAMTPAQQIFQMGSCPASTASVCAPAGQCLLAGGVSTGNCAMGLLVCCIQKREIPQGCSATNNLLDIRDKLSTISSSDDAKTCQFEIYKADENVCQLQLDFDTFELEPPLWGEDCSPDSVMTISDSVTVQNGFPLCGKHSGTQMYLGYGRSSRISLSFARLPTDTYKIRIKQIDCNSAERIPDQCLQNREGRTGLVTNFGFPQYMINNQKYTVCINANSVFDHGRISWKECSALEAGNDSEHNFILSEYFITNNASTDPSSYYQFYNSADQETLFIPSEGEACSRTTHVEIHGEDKHCGARFVTTSKSVRSESRPYMLTANIVEDTARNLPDFAFYRIPGVHRTSGEFPDKVGPNDCEYSETERAGDDKIPSTQGFESCKIISKDKKENVQYDLCLCMKKEGKDIPEKPKPRPDLLQRSGFCLRYSVS